LTINIRLLPSVLSRIKRLVGLQRPRHWSDPGIPGGS